MCFHRSCTLHSTKSRNFQHWCRATTWRSWISKEMPSTILQRYSFLHLAALSFRSRWKAIPYTQSQDIERVCWKRCHSWAHLMTWIGVFFCQSNMQHVCGASNTCRSTPHILKPLYQCGGQLNNLRSTSINTVFIQWKKDVLSWNKSALSLCWMRCEHVQTFTFTCAKIDDENCASGGDFVSVCVLYIYIYIYIYI